MKSPQPETPATVLLLQIPRTNDKKALAAEQMFASLQGLLVQPSKGFLAGPVRERLSFEIAVINRRIGFYVWVPTYLKSFVEEQIYAQYPTVQISEVEDYAREEKHYPITVVSDMHMTQSDVLPIKTFQSFEVDPLAAITATLATFTEQEEAWLQMVVRPATEQWHKKNEKYLAHLKGGHPSIWKMLAPSEKPAAAPHLTEYQQVRATGAEAKGQKLAYETIVRIVYRGQGTEQAARLRLQSIASSYKQFNSTYLNGFEQGKVGDALQLHAYQHRSIVGKHYVMNIEEVATLYHLPHTNVETPFILWATSQTAEPPANLPLVTETYNPNISPVAVTNFRGRNTAFGLPRSDRGRHLYILGQTGVGKSALLELLTISDVYSPFGFAIIDPHGDYAQNILQRIPKERMEDVVYFNAADTQFPIAFNPLEVYDEKLKTHTCSELIGVLKRLFDSWGPRLEYILRYSILALLDYPNATMLDITRILTDKKFRIIVLTYVSDPVVKNFWQVEFASWNDKFATEAVAPVLNKVGAFTANPLVRNIIGQPRSSFNIRKLMDERKIIIVNLTRGLVGEDNAALLGALIVTKIQMAAMSRADITLEERAPFYLYVDEFQNFATDSFATILSEARKYGLCLTVANQYTAQMMQEVKDAVFGNVGSIIAFRMSADDASGMQRYFEPKFLEYDLIHMHNRHFIISMTVEGEKSPAFSGTTLELPPLQEDNTPYIIDHSRRLYARPLAEVEEIMHAAYDTNATGPNANVPAAQEKSKTPPPKAKAKPAPPTTPAPATPPAASAAPAPTPAPQPTPTKPTLHVPTHLPMGGLVTLEDQPPMAAPILQPEPSVPLVTASVMEPDEVLIFHRDDDMSVAADNSRREQSPAPKNESPQPVAPSSPQPAAADSEESAPKKRRRRRRKAKTAESQTSARTS
ncbi:MAG TPA: DUF87 domain-containing protein [Candidatus Saccharimonadales bacterium]|nr:DUF87 domain-containing protein [Candidatus Saccharimonadales bacterium]